MTPAQTPVTVTQEDREAAWLFAPVCYKDCDKADWMAGGYDKVAKVIQAFARHRIQAAASSSAEMARLVEAERSAVVSYLNHAADEAGSLAEKAQTEATAAMFRAIRNAFVALGKSIAEGDHLLARAALSHRSEGEKP